MLRFQQYNLDSFFSLTSINNQDKKRQKHLLNLLLHKPS